MTDLEGNGQRERITLNEVMMVGQTLQQTESRQRSDKTSILERSGGDGGEVQLYRDDLNERRNCTEDDMKREREYECIWTIGEREKKS